MKLMDLKNNMIKLERAYLPDCSATFGKLTINDWSCYTLENPWKNNQRNISCIPEGMYPLKTRESPIVQRTSGGSFRIGWEVSRVPGRSFIMFHPGNWAKDTDGCILVGQSFSWSSQYGPMVTNSRNTFVRFMEKLEGQNEWSIKIAGIQISA